MNKNKKYPKNTYDKDLIAVNFNYIICSLTPPKPKKNEWSNGILISNASIYYSNIFQVDPNVNFKLSAFNINMYIFIYKKCYHYILDIEKNINVTLPLLLLLLIIFSIVNTRNLYFFRIRLLKIIMEKFILVKVFI